MPTPQPPLILVDNVFDRINLYPLAVLSSSGDAVGRDKEFIADYRRERDYWQAATAATNRYVQVDLGAGNSRAVDSCWIDRLTTVALGGLWGLTVVIEAGDDGATWPDSVSRAVPASGTVGGDPETSWCVTEEGAIYTLFTPFSARRYFRVRISTSAQPVIAGVIVGKRIQLLNYSSVRDEDAGERSNRVEKSLVPGYEGRDRTYARRTINLKLSTIGATEYDSSIRTLRRLLFETDQPAVVVHNYGTNPERAWLYQYEGPNWSSPMQRVLRDLGLPMSEVGPLVR